MAMLRASFHGGSLRHDSACIAPADWSKIVDTPREVPKARRNRPEITMQRDAGSDLRPLQRPGLAGFRARPGRRRVARCRRPPDRVARAGAEGAAGPRRARRAGGRQGRTDAPRLGRCDRHRGFAGAGGRRHPARARRSEATSACARCRDAATCWCSMLPRRPCRAGASGGGEPAPRHGRWRLPSCVALVALAAGLYLWPQPDAPSRTLAILPFDKDAATEDWFVDGVTNELTTIVAGWRDVQVIGRGTMATYKGQRGRSARDRPRTRRAPCAGRSRAACGRPGAPGGGAGRHARRPHRLGRPARRASRRARRCGWRRRRRHRARVDGAATATPSWSTRSSSRPDQAQADDLALQGMAELLRSVSREHWEGARVIFERGLEIDPDSPPLPGRRQRGQYQSGAVGMD